jgi:hypothetical protein
VLVFCAVLLAPAAARADFADDYVAGLAALDHGDYAQALQSLKKALAAQSTPVSHVTIEGNPQPYLPHHFLGMAQLKLGDCAAAKAEWNDPMNLRMIGRLRQLRTQEEQLLGQCTPSAAGAAAKSTTPQSTQTVDVPPAANAPPSTQSPATATPPPKPVASAPAGPPPVLVRAFDDLMAGRYANVAKLDADALIGAHARFQGYLLRSAARFALARSGDKNQLEAARRDAHAAQALDQSVPDERVFSPAFRTFYTASH